MGLVNNTIRSHMNNTHSKSGNYPILSVHTNSRKKLFLESEFNSDVDFTEKSNSQNEGTSSALVGILNIVNCIFGVGILGLPIVACKLGLIATLILQPILAIITAWTAKLIINAKKRTNSQTYEEICEKLLGYVGFWMLNISLWLMLICIMGMYICFAVKFVYPLINGLGLTTWTKGDTFYGICIGFISFSVIPLLLLKDLSRLGFVSTLGMFAVMLLLILTTIAVPLDNQVKEKPATLWKVDWMLHKDTTILIFLEQFGVFLTGFMGHHTVCSIENSLTNKKEMNKVINWSFSIVVFLNIWFILAVYLGYGGVQCTNLFGIPGNELYKECYYTDNREDLYTNLFTKEKSGFAFWLIVAGSINECISLVMTLPLIHFFLRDLTWGIYLKFKNSLSIDKNNIPKWFVNSHLIFWLISACMALFLQKQILQFLAFIGSFGIPFVQLVLPILLNMELTNGIFYYISFGCLKKKTSKFPLGEESNESNSLITMLIMNTVLIFGFIQIGLSFKILLDIIQ